MLALTRDISAAIARCELTHLARAPIDLTVARREHDAYEDALRNAGCRVERLAADDEMADSVFIEDTAVVLDEIAIITRPGAASRRREVDPVRDALRRHRAIAGIAAPGTLDGGDVLRVGRRLLVGDGPRTNEAGRTQLAAVVEPHGYTVEAIAFDGCLHLKTAVTLVGDGIALCNPEWVAPEALGIGHVIAVDPSEPFAGNALRIHGKVLHPAELSRTGDRLRRAGVGVVAVPAGELAKAEGGLTCGSLLVG